jgi:hypothetical protein
VIYADGGHSNYMTIDELIYQLELQKFCNKYKVSEQDFYDLETFIDNYVMHIVNETRDEAACAWDD